MSSEVVSVPQPSPDWLVGGGEMGARMRALDWDQTPLGPIESWSPTLKTMTRFLLVNRFPILLWWGPQFCQREEKPTCSTTLRKYSEKGSRIWFQTEQAGDEIVVRVRDTGIGIPADKLPNVFDMFMQVDLSLERSQGGLGIGLNKSQRKESFRYVSSG